MNAPQYASLCWGEIRGLIGRWRLRLRPDSILAAGLKTSAEAPRVPAPAPDAWRPALAALARPDRCLRVVAPGPATTPVAVFCAAVDAADFGWVGCWPEGGGLRLSVPWAPEALAQAAAKLVLAELPIPVDPFSAELSLAGLTALMAAVDVLRVARFMALLQRRVEVASRFTLAELRRQLDLGLTHHDARWSVTLLRLTAPGAAFAAGEVLGAGLHDLARAGLVSLEGADWRPTQALLRLSAHWTMPLPALAHELTTWRGDAVQGRHYRLAIRGDGPLWVIDCGGLAPGRAVVRCVDGDAYVRQTAALCASPPVEAARSA
jgi:hypothetical protein